MMNRIVISNPPEFELIKDDEYDEFTISLVRTSGSRKTCTREEAIKIRDALLEMYPLEENKMEQVKRNLLLNIREKADDALVHLSDWDRCNDYVWKIQDDLAELVEILEQEYIERYPNIP